MTKRERKQMELAMPGIFTGALLLLLILAGLCLEQLSAGENSVFDALREASLESQLKRQGYMKQYADSGHLAYGVEPVGYLLEGLTVEQDFTVTEEMLDWAELAVGIEVATYGRKNAVNLYVEIYQDQGYGKAYKIDASGLKDNKDVNISFPTEGLEAGVCHVKVYSDAASGNQAVTVYTTQNCVLAERVSVAGSEKEANLVMRVYTPYVAEP